MVKDSTNAHPSLGIPGNSNCNDSCIEGQERSNELDFIFHYLIIRRSFIELWLQIYGDHETVRSCIDPESW